MDAKTRSSASTSNRRCCDLHQYLDRLPGLFGGAELIDELFQAIRRGRLRVHFFAGTLNGFGDARFVERLQHVVHGVHVEGLHGVMIESGGEDHVRDFDFALDQLLQHPEAVEAGHLHVEENQVGGVLLDQRDGFDAVLPLPDDADLGKTLEQKSQLVASGLFVIDNDGGDGHRV